MSRDNLWASISFLSTTLITFLGNFQNFAFFLFIFFSSRITAVTNIDRARVRSPLIATTSAFKSNSKVKSLQSNELMQNYFPVHIETIECHRPDLRRNIANALSHHLRPLNDSDIVSRPHKRMVDAMDTEAGRHLNSRVDAVQNPPLEHRWVIEWWWNL